MSITITRLRIENFEGISSLDIEPGALTVLRGRNGAGKTSVLEAVMAAITNGAIRAKMVKDGADSGAILAWLSDGTEIEREVTASGRTAGPVNLTRDGRTLKSPQSVLNGLFDGFGFNPVAFLGLSPSRQREEILRVTDLDLPLDEALRLSGGDDLGEVDYTAHPLQVLKQIEEALFDWRRDVNRDVKSKKSTAEEMRKSVGGVDIDTDRLLEFDISDVTEKLHDARRDERSLSARVKRQGEIEEAVRQLEAEREINDAQVRDLQLNQQDIAALEADVRTFQRDRDAWKTLQDAGAINLQAEEMDAKSKSLTVLIEETRGKPAELLRDAVLPVDGLAIDDDGNVTINGLPISELSTGEQLMIAVSISIATLPEDGIRIVLVDGLEKLDEGNRSLLLDKMAEADVQVLATEVGEGELTVITDYYGAPSAPF